MPKENKHSRGKRGGEKSKRKRDDTENGGNPSKRQRPSQIEDVQYTGAGNDVQFQSGAFEPESTERPFYGLLEDDEQEYFRHADELLEANEFENDEQRQLFLSNVYREAEGKELKIANSQSCSRLMERLILLSTPAQKKTLFEKFSGNFLYLIQHRFASHCCETLFIHSAPIVTSELLEDSREDNANGETTESMENLFLYTLNELESSLASLLIDRFASHTLRVLLMVLSGKPLDGVKKNLLQSKKKEKITVHGKNPEIGDISKDRRAVPDSFQVAVDKIKTDTIINDESGFIDLLAMNPMGNPCLQLLLEIELTTPQGKTKGNEQKSIIRKLLPDDLSTSESKGVTFINALVYDSIGSRLIETIVTYAPAKLFKQIYKACFKDRIGSLARNETAGFVVVKVLERLNLQDLRDAITLILPQIPSLVERSRTSVIRTLVERCVVRGADTKELAKTLKTCYGEDPKDRISKMVNPEPKAIEGVPKPDANSKNFSQLHGSLLAQTMLDVPGPLSELIQDCLVAQSPEKLLSFSEETFTSHIIQAALKPSETNVAFRRKFVNKLLPFASALAIHTSGSHVVNALWRGTEGILNLKERIAASLQDNESILRDSFDGRKIWRNWMMDLFKRQKAEWVKKVKAGEGGPLFRGKDVHGEKQDVGGKGGKEVNATRPYKTKMELARDKFWSEKEINKGKGAVETGANKLPTV